MFIRFKNGAMWQVLGSDRYDAAVGSAPYGITFSEWALSNPASWAYLAPIVLENNGWAVFITTARGRSRLQNFGRHIGPLHIGSPGVAICPRIRRGAQGR